MHGLPIAIKDLVHIRGRMTTAGSKARPHGIASDNATATTHLLAAGMIPLGKTHLVEFAYGAWGRNAPMGAPWNPWDTKTHRVAGGSSSGSAVAVAAGLAPAAVGSDTGGSIRIPSGLCGLTGLKPTYGVISLAGVVPLATTLDSLGPLARNVDDAALLTAVMGGPDPRDPATRAAPAIDFAGAMAAEPDIGGMRITALAVDQFHWPATPDVLKAREAALVTLRALGASIEEERVPFDLEDVMLRSGRIIAAEAWALHRGYIEDETLPFDPGVRSRLLAAKAIGAADYIDELAMRAKIAGAFADWMRGRAADADAADRRHAIDRSRRSDDTARHLHACGQLPRHLRALAASGIFARRPADRRAAHGRAVRGRDAGSHRARLSARDRLASAQARSFRMGRVARATHYAPQRSSRVGAVCSILHCNSASIAALDDVVTG